MTLQYRHTYKCNICNFSLDIYSNQNDLDFPKCNCDKVAIKIKTIQWDNESLEKNKKIIFSLDPSDISK
jgi:hypothetical protein